MGDDGILAWLIGNVVIRDLELWLLETGVQNVELDELALRFTSAKTDWATMTWSALQLASAGESEGCRQFVESTSGSRTTAGASGSWIALFLPADSQKIKNNIETQQTGKIIRVHECIYVFVYNNSVWNIITMHLQ